MIGSPIPCPFVHAGSFAVQYTLPTRYLCLVFTTTIPSRKASLSSELPMDADGYRRLVKLLPVPLPHRLYLLRLVRLSGDGFRSIIVDGRQNTEWMWLERDVRTVLETYTGGREQALEYQGPESGATTTRVPVGLQMRGRLDVDEGVVLLYTSPSQWFIVVATRADITHTHTRRVAW